jgi:uncharacterized iron-regulated protein
LSLAIADRFLISPIYSQAIKNIDNNKILQAIKPANIIYLGEIHENLQVHQVQLEIIKKLHKNNSKIAIAMEMFQRQYQKYVDKYLVGNIDEKQLKEKTEYDSRWGFDWEYYVPILRFAKENKLAVLAANTPTEVTKKVAREGLENLTEAEKIHIPPLTEIRTDNKNYRQMLQQIYENHAGQGRGNSQKFDNFFTAQVLWDETIAETIAKYYQTHPQHQIIVLAGQGHIVYGYGIPSRVARRLQNYLFLQLSILIGETEDNLFKQQNPQEIISDYIWNLK